MPIKDPEKRRLANAERMRRRRAEGDAWIDPEKEAARKRRWYDAGGKEKIVACNRARRQRANEQALSDFTNRLTKGAVSSAEGEGSELSKGVAGLVEESARFSKEVSPRAKGAAGVSKGISPRDKGASRLAKEITPIIKGASRVTKEMTPVNKGTSPLKKRVSQSS